MKGLATLSQDEFNKKMDEYNAALEKMKENEKKRPPLDFVLQYMPHPKDTTGNIDKQAPMGAAYEEMGQRTSIPTEELTQMLNESFDDLVQNGEVELGADVVDLNKDGKVDLGEYATTILVSDALSSNQKVLDVKNINGQVTNKGEDTAIAYANKKNYNIANRNYQALYDYYGLAQAQKEFVQNENNLLK